MDDKKQKDLAKRRAKYSENAERIREKCLARYYAKKQENPDFHNKRMGRPRKYPDTDAKEDA